MQFKKINLLLTIIVFSIFLMGVGYATVNNVTLTIGGTASTADNGLVKITNVSIVNSTNVTVTTPTWTDTTVNFSASFTVNSTETAQQEHSVVYSVTVLNDSLDVYQFGSDVFNPQLNMTTPDNNSTLTPVFEYTGVTFGQAIPAKASITFTVKLTLNPQGSQGNYGADVTTEVDSEPETQGLLLGSLNTPYTGNLSGNNQLAHFSANFLNSYTTQKSFTLSINNSNFQIVDQNGNALSTITINAETNSQTVDFYIKKVSSAKFPKSPVNFNVFYTPTGESAISMGTLSITVDVDNTINDHNPPTISSFSAVKGNTTKTIALSWAATDDSGSIDHYNLYMYNQNGTLIDSVTNYTNVTKTIGPTLSNGNTIQDGTYNFKLQAFDGKGNMTEQTISNKQYRWTYTITLVNSDGYVGSSNTSYSVQAGGSWSTTLSGTGSALQGKSQVSTSDVTVTMKDSSQDPETEAAVSNAISSGSNNTVNVSISSATGDITINAEASCLVEGTKILLYNGKTKNVEDINYDDLLAVWNHDTGKITYEYPLWIEKKHKAVAYVHIKFSDGGDLKIVGNHSLYATEYKKYISLHDKEFRKGTKVARITNDGKFKETTITSINTIQKEVNYYFIGSTTYFNIIANNLLTTDRLTLISNFYGFEDNAKWPSYKQAIVSDGNNITAYEDLKDVLPHYLYKGFRAGEVGYLINNNLMTLNGFKYYVSTLITNIDMIKKPITINNEPYWMVTTSENIIYSNKGKFLRKEGSKYILPKSNKFSFKGWLNTSDNKIYKPGDTVSVDHGLHFIALYK